MEPFTPFAGPYANGLSPWHHSGHFDRSFNDDSGYASEDSDSVPFLSSDPDHDHEYHNQVNHCPPWLQRHRTAALVSAQGSRPGAFRACHPFHDSFGDSSRTYDPPQPLPFEEQPNNSVSGSRLKPTTSYSREIFDREPGHTASRWDLEEKISPLDFEGHRACVPDALPSLSNRIQCETDHYAPSPNPIGHTPQLQKSNWGPHNPWVLSHLLNRTTETRIRCLRLHGLDVNISLQATMHNSQVPGNSYVRSARSLKRIGEP